MEKKDPAFEWKMPIRFNGPVGLFSLTGFQGKILSVRVAKEGYHMGQESFGSYEYAAFFDSSYYQPDPGRGVPLGQEDQSRANDRA